ncbi:universal stress protein [Heliorestis acidaminivorans]|uniref:Universal stress protein n=1 Tax=Heliorestis acidaminivorans TaxID=553427 RepID=A0A6I0EYR7_9FIRM|nr:universal stress protein [Heliorestis acidaminivorans]KAB2951932.1 universal stress protein [Heliorestis acidaminivorans]
MLEKVLLCTDLSPPSDKLVQFVASLGNVGVKEVILAHILSTGQHPALDLAVPENIIKKLEQQKRILENKGLQVSIEVSFGIPSAELKNLAEKKDVSAIVIGSHGKGIFKKLAIGSVSSEVLQNTSIPCLFIPIALVDTEECYQLPCESLFSKILYCTDFSTAGKQSFIELKKIGQERDLSVTILHVQDRSLVETYYWQKIDDVAEEIFEELKQQKSELDDAGLKDVHIKLSYGFPKETIIERLQNEEYSLLLMGSQGKGYIEELFLGSVSYSVVRKSPVPVLLVPPKR